MLDYHNGKSMVVPDTIKELKKLTKQKPLPCDSIMDNQNEWMEMESSLCTSCCAFLVAWILLHHTFSFHLLAIIFFVSAHQYNGVANATTKILVEITY